MSRYTATSSAADQRRRLRRSRLFQGQNYPAEKKRISDYQEFRRKNFGRFLLTTDPAKGVDIYYGELTELFGEGYFPSEITNPADQLQHISHVMDGMNDIREPVQRAGVR